MQGTSRPRWGWAVYGSLIVVFVLGLSFGWVRETAAESADAVASPDVATTATAEPAPSPSPVATATVPPEPEPTETPVDDQVCIVLIGGACPEPGEDRSNTRTVAASATGDSASCLLVSLLLAAPADPAPELTAAECKTQIDGLKANIADYIKNLKDTEKALGKDGTIAKALSDLRKEVEKKKKAIQDSKQPDATKEKLLKQLDVSVVLLIEIAEQSQKDALENLQKKQAEVTKKFDAAKDALDKAAAECAKGTKEGFAAAQKLLDAAHKDIRSGIVLAASAIQQGELPNLQIEAAKDALDMIKP